MAHLLTRKAGHIFLGSSHWLFFLIVWEFHLEKCKREEKRYEGKMGKDSESWILALKGNEQKDPIRILWFTKIFPNI